MAKFWVAVASREHVMRGVKDCFAQVCHGKQGPLKRMMPGDWIVYYSPTEIFGDKVPCRKFTAIGTVSQGDPYLFEMSKDFIPWRRKVNFVPSKDIAIDALLAKLSFIQDKRHWGFIFRRGFFEIPKEDFYFIAHAMGVDIDE